MGPLGPSKWSAAKNENSNPKSKNSTDVLFWVWVRLSLSLSLVKSWPGYCWEHRDPCRMEARTRAGEMKDKSDRAPYYASKEHFCVVQSHYLFLDQGLAWVRTMTERDSAMHALCLSRVVDSLTCLPCYSRRWSFASLGGCIILCRCEQEGKCSCSLVWSE